MLLIKNPTSVSLHKELQFIKLFFLLATRVSNPDRLTNAYTMQQCSSILSIIFHKKKVLYLLCSI